MATRHTNVYFEFVSAEYDPVSIRGTVIDRGHEMSLELGGEEESYSVTGKMIGHYFAGRDDDVTAKWTQLGTEFIGMWVEDGQDWFFRFRLTSKTTAR